MTIQNTTREVIASAERQLANYHEYLRRTGQGFNVFKILNRHTDEEFGHSSFIAELLNPKGSHGLGRVFLDLFFSVVELDHLQKFHHWEVATEVGRDVEGRLDILLTGRSETGERFSVAIENKIYATDGTRQLYRYWDYLKNSFSKTETNGSQQGVPYRLYYLTLGGYPPSGQSVKGIPASELAYLESGETGPVRLLSYSDDILKWLRLCLEKLSTYPQAREVLAQYIQVVEQLTGNGGGMTESLVE